MKHKGLTPCEVWLESRLLCASSMGRDFLETAHDSEVVRHERGGGIGPAQALAGFGY